jgi:hypothetical protein
MVRMKKLWFIVCLLFIAESVFGQQNLWTTSKSWSDSKGVKYVPIANVNKEVLKFYRQYEYYYDFSGYSKSRFIEDVQYGFSDWSWLNKINELTVYAMKSNTGYGSLILVICVSKDNVNLLIFSNDVSAARQLPRMTNEYEEGKFSRWFKTLLN